MASTKDKIIATNQVFWTHSGMLVFGAQVATAVAVGPFAFLVVPIMAGASAASICANKDALKVISED